MTEFVPAHMETCIRHVMPRVRHHPWQLAKPCLLLLLLGAKGGEVGLLLRQLRHQPRQHFIVVQRPLIGKLLVELRYLINVVATQKEREER